MRRSALVIVTVLGVGCVCGPTEPDGGVDSGTPDAGAVDAGPDRDGGMDAGPDRDGGTDAGRVDGGVDAGGDSGVFDAGFDAGSFLCASLPCAPWQTCVEVGGTARCTGTVTISWVSPVTGASAPLDIDSIPLAIDTSAGPAVDVPWSSSGVITAAGTFSGQMGIRGATLLMTDTDAGIVVLTAGWDGGPQATTQLVLDRPSVRVPPAPSYGANTNDFEPNDPAGLAFRRDDVVPIEVDELPQPMALFARLDAPNARPMAVPIVARCDAGTCRRVDLDLKPLHFPTFRGRVLVWATAADGGIQTRPRSIPVTRWRWRRQVSNVPNPISVTRPVFMDLLGGIAVGSSDTATTGNHLVLSGEGNPASTTRWPSWPAPGASISAFTRRPTVAMFQADGGWLWQMEQLPDRRPTGRVLACSHANDLAVCMTDEAKLERVRGSPTDVSTVDSGCPLPQPGDAFLGSVADNTHFSPGRPLCVTRFATFPHPVESTTLTNGRYGRAFASVGEDQVKVLASGADGGLWLVQRVGFGPTLTEQLLWDGGIVDGVGESEIPIPALERSWTYWATADGRVHRAQHSATFGPEQVASERLTNRLSTTPVLAFDPNDGGTALFVSTNGDIAAYDFESLLKVWSLPSGDAGIRGNRVDTDPIGIQHCARHGSLIVPSSGDGSLYAFILDGARFTWTSGRSSWCMAGRSPEGETITVFDHCITD